MPTPIISMNSNSVYGYESVQRLGYAACTCSIILQDFISSQDIHVTSRISLTGF